MEQYLHFTICLHGIVLNYICIGKILRLPEVQTVPKGSWIFELCLLTAPFWRPRELQLTVNFSPSLARQWPDTPKHWKCSTSFQFYYAVRKNRYLKSASILRSNLVPSSDRQCTISVLWPATPLNRDDTNESWPHLASFFPDGHYQIVNTDTPRGMAELFI
jgi:hypothetical protein